MSILSRFKDTVETASNKTKRNGAHRGTNIDGEPLPQSDAWEINHTESVEGKAVKAVGSDALGNSLFTGPDALPKIYAHSENPTQPVLFGVGTRRGQWAAVKKQSFRRHAAIFGPTGYGKSNFLNVLIQQITRDGSGAWILDAKGDLVDDILARLPDECLDRTVVVDPTDERRDYVCGFNLLDVPIEPGEPGHIGAVENLRVDLTEAIAGEDYFGPLMGGVLDTAIRVAAHSPETWTVADLSDALMTEESRSQFAEYADQYDMKEKFLDYYEDIGSMEQDKLDALIRRLKNWMEDARARQVIATRNTALSFSDLLDENAIVLWDLGKNADDDLKAMQSRVALRRVWSAVKARDEERSYEGDIGDPGSNDDDNDGPETFLIADEFDLMVDSGGNADMSDKTVENILSKSRSMGLSAVFCAQYPSQLPDGVVDAIYWNSDTICSFRAKGRDANKLAEILGVEKGTLGDEQHYHIWMSVFTERTGDLSDAFRTYILPAPPAIRTANEVRELKTRLIKDRGQPRKSNQQTRSELKFSGDGATTPTPDDTDDAGLTTDDYPLLYKAVYDAQLVHSPDPINPSPINYEQIEPALRAALASQEIKNCDPEQISDSMIQSVIDQLTRDGRHLHESSEYEYHVGPDGLDFLDLDTPDSADPRNGVRPHRRGIKHSYRWLTHYLPECNIEIPDQGGTESDLHINDPATFSGTGLAVQKQRDQFEAEYPLRAVLTGGNNTDGEFESTTKHKDTKLVGKIQRAYDESRACLFICWSIDDANTISRHLAKPDLRDDLPDAAQWHTVILPSDSNDSGIDSDSSSGLSSKDQPQPQPHLYIGEAKGLSDPTTIPFSDVSPQAIDDALSSETGSDTGSPSPKGLDVSDI